MISTAPDRSPRISLRRVSMDNLPELLLSTTSAEEPVIAWNLLCGLTRLIVSVSNFSPQDLIITDDIKLFALKLISLVKEDIKVPS